MTNSRLLGIVLLGFLSVGVWLSVFIVDEREKAILFRLGEIVKSDFEPGIHFMIPIFQNVKKYDKRLLTLDAKPEQILTGEKKNVMVDYFVKWRIRDIEKFYRSFGGRENDAQLRMAQIIQNGLQAELGDRTIKEVVSDQREVIMQNVTTDADAKVSEFGIEIFDLRIKQIELPINVRTSVFERMKVERDRIAKEHRAKGEKESKIIKAKADRKRTEMLADAKRKSEEIRGSGDAIATDIYARAYGKNEEFYTFYRSMIAYRNTFNSKQDILVLEPDSEFFRYFGSSKAGKR